MDFSIEQRETDGGVPSQWKSRSGMSHPGIISRVDTPTEFSRHKSETLKPDQVFGVTTLGGQ